MVRQRSAKPLFAGSIPAHASKNMTTYDLIKKNTQKTYLFIFFFLLIIIGIGWLLAYVFNELWILIVAVVFSVTTAITSYWNSDKIVLSLNRAKQITAKENKELYRIVENLCITAGLPMPKIYIIDDPSPNAFATGRDPKHSAIAITTGLLDILNKQELEGVIGHELTHIKNRDTLLATTIIVLVGIISFISEIAIRSSFYGEDNEREASTYMLIIGSIAIILAPIVAYLIQLAISRKREFLADSGSVMLTRYPQGLISALEKLSQSKISLKHASPTMAHLYIVNPFKNKKSKSWLKKMFLTHPPIEERIAALKSISI